MWDVKPFWNYTSVDPKQFTVSKFRLKPVILISECFCSRCGHTNQHPPPTWRETKGDKTTSEPKKAATPTNTHPPHEGRQPETTGDKTTSEPKKPTTPTNTKAARSKVALRTPTVNCLYSIWQRSRAAKTDAWPSETPACTNSQKSDIDLINVENTLQRVLSRKFLNHLYKFVNLRQWNIRNTTSNACTSNLRTKRPKGFAIGSTGTRH